MQVHMIYHHVTLISPYCTIVIVTTSNDVTWHHNLPLLDTILYLLHCDVIWHHKMGYGNVISAIKRIRSTHYALQYTTTQAMLHSLPGIWAQDINRKHSTSQYSLVDINTCLGYVLTRLKWKYPLSQNYIQRDLQVNKQLIYSTLQQYWGGRQERHSAWYGNLQRIYMTLT